jgi:hypothetical protein
VAVALVAVALVAVALVAVALVAVALVAVALVAELLPELLPGGRAAAGAAAWWPTWWPSCCRPTWCRSCCLVFVFVSTWCLVFVIRWPGPQTLGPRAPVRVAWAVGRVAGFAGPGPRALAPK